MQSIKIDTLITYWIGAFAPATNLLRGASPRVARQTKMSYAWRGPHQEKGVMQSKNETSVSLFTTVA